MIRVLIVHDHTVVRMGLRQVVSGAQGMVVAAEAAPGPEAVESARLHDIDVAVLEVTMPGRGGLELLRELRQVRPTLAVVMFTLGLDDHHAVRSVRGGAAAYLSRSCTAEELVHAIRAAAAGERYITPGVADLLASALAEGEGTPLHERLSDRELQILLLIAAGMSLEQAAHELTLSTKTVSTYKKRVLEKMGMRTSAQLIRYALEVGLVK